MSNRENSHYNVFNTKIETKAENVGQYNALGRSNVREIRSESQIELPIGLLIRVFMFGVQCL